MKKETYNVRRFIREDIQSIAPYVSARMGHHVHAKEIILNANESPYAPYGYEQSSYNRYPEPQPVALRYRLASIWGGSEQNLLMARGSDEAIDLICRATCVAGKDAVITLPPTFEIYRLAAKLQGAEVIESAPNLQDTLQILDGSPHVKLVFICSPNNPSGHAYKRQDLLAFIEAVGARALVVVDEAYVEFSQEKSLVGDIANYPWLIVLRTLSKAWGLAGVRVGGLFADPILVEEISKIQQVYPIPAPVVDTVLNVLTPMGIALIQERTQILIEERKRLFTALKQLDNVIDVAHSEGNFLLVQFAQKEEVLARLQKGGVTVRDRHKLVENTLRITVGKPDENDLLLRLLGAKPPAGEDVQHSKPREGYIVRKTKETAIECFVNLDCQGESKIDTGVGFFDHMLEQIPLHGHFTLKLKCSGDLHVDAHHLIEDTAIVLGECIRKALGNKSGIERYGFTTAMDEAHTQMQIDLSGRGVYVQKGSYGEVMLGAYPSSMTGHFLRSLADNLRCALQVRVEGEDIHHMVESSYKALGRVLCMALERGNRGLNPPSSKGSL